MYLCIYTHIYIYTCINSEPPPTGTGWGAPPADVRRGAQAGEPHVARQPRQVNFGSGFGVGGLNVHGLRWGVDSESETTGYEPLDCSGGRVEG